MLRYTIGILFNEELDQCLYIKKNKPKWQAGLYNFPGGKIEQGEDIFDCVAREFEEETSLIIPKWDWEHIGQIQNKNLGYTVDILTTIHKSIYGTAKQVTDEPIKWFTLLNSNNKSFITNVGWLTYLAHNFHKQGQLHDVLTFANITYI